MTVTVESPCFSSFSQFADTLQLVAGVSWESKDGYSRPASWQLLNLQKLGHLWLHIQYRTQPFHNNIFWSSFLLASQCIYNVKDFLMVSVFLSAFHKGSIELHGKLFSCLISPWINLPHSLICTGSILQYETNYNWLEGLRLELKYIGL